MTTTDKKRRPCNRYMIAPSRNMWGIPDQPRYNGPPPAALVPYRTRADWHTFPDDTAVHFFIDDYRFESVWSYPARGLKYLNRFGLALTPDFSVLDNDPLAVQLWNVYRARTIGVHWHRQGIDVIPTLTWAGPETYSFCFAGVEPGAMVALTAQGTLNDPPALARFEQGLRAMLDTVQPRAVLVYGTLPEYLHHLADFTFYPHWREAIT